MAFIPATVPDQISDIKEREISYRTLHPEAYVFNQENNREIRIPFSSIINKYRHFLDKIIIKIQLTEEEQVNYECQPKKISEDMYGTTELWDTILILNNAKSVIDFKPRVVKLYDPQKFKTFLNEIMIIEEELGNISF